MSVEPPPADQAIPAPMPNLRKLEFSPRVNPLLESTVVTVKKHYVQSGIRKDLIDRETGEVTGISVIRTIEERDDITFVKVFADGVRAAFGLSATAARVFQAVLSAYEREKMSGGYAESVNLFWFDDGLDGHKLDMSEKTFQRGLKELLAKRFLYPKQTNIYWVNPALFFRGDRVAFIKEYKRKSKDTDKPAEVNNSNGKDTDIARDGVQTDLFENASA